MKKKFRYLVLSLFIINGNLLFAQGSVEIQKKKTVIAKEVPIIKWVSKNVVGNITNPHLTNELYPDLKNMYNMQVWEVAAFPSQIDNGTIKAMVNPNLKLVKEITDIKIGYRTNSKDSYYYEIAGVPYNTNFIIVFKCKMGATSAYVQNKVENKFSLTGAFFSGQDIPTGSENTITAIRENTNVTSNHVINIGVEKKNIVTPK